ncbi:protein of unknown function [Cyanobium sp. NIES-981]|nr:protein of unknown function [Cyanobium sp. NIES-981]
MATIPEQSALSAYRLVNPALIRS